MANSRIGTSAFTAEGWAGSFYFCQRPEVKMWILKGISVGLGVFFVGTLIYVINELRPIEAQKATALSAITGPTLYNPWWWMALIAILALACWFFRPK
jgi:hypothetical protein